MHWIDPDCLPELRGRLARFLVNPHGEADGLLLDGGAEVHFPPHMAEELVPALEQAANAELRIRGVRPREGDVFAAVAVELPDGVRFEDRGPEGHKPKGPKAHAEREERALSGRVARALHGPKGERRGVLLESGEIVRFPPHAAEPALTRPGASLAARGKALRTRLGEVIEAKALGPDLARLHAIEPDKKPPKKPKPPHPDHQAK